MIHLFGLNKLFFKKSYIIENNRSFFKYGISNVETMFLLTKKNLESINTEIKKRIISMI